MTVYNTGKVRIGSRYETPRFKSPTHPEIIRDADRIQRALLATREPFIPMRFAIYLGSMIALLIGVLFL